MIWSSPPHKRPEPMLQPDRTRPSIRQLRRDQLDEGFIDRWDRLEARALECNAFLSPHFALPALDYLTQDVQPVILAVLADPADLESLIGLGIFEKVLASPALPVPHLRAYNSIHSFMDGLLIDRAYARSALETFFEFLRSPENRWHGVHFTQCRADSEQAALIESIATELHATSHTIREWERPVLIPSEVTSNYLHDLYSGARRKNFRRAQRKLATEGTIGFRVYRCGNDYDTHCNTFLQLEAMGWKGEEQSALLSKAHETRFFQEMSSGFARSQRALFIELTLDGKPVFSSSNYLSGTECFGFKSGWHTDYHACSPGTQGELMTLAHAPTVLSDVDVMDSCAEPGQYIAGIWPWRRRMASRVFTTTNLARRASALTSALSRLKRRLASGRNLRVED